MRFLRRPLESEGNMSYNAGPAKDIQWHMRKVDLMQTRSMQMKKTPSTRSGEVLSKYAWENSQKKKRTDGRQLFIAFLGLQVHTHSHIHVCLHIYIHTYMQSASPISFVHGVAQHEDV